MGGSRPSRLDLEADQQQQVEEQVVVQAEQEAARRSPIAKPLKASELSNNTVLQFIAALNKFADSLYAQQAQAGPAPAVVWSNRQHSMSVSAGAAQLCESSPNVLNSTVPDLL